MWIHPTTHRAALSATLIGAAALALTACNGSKPPAASAPTAVPHAIVFAVTGHGTATLTWPGGSNTHTALPWNSTREIPLGPDGVTLTVQLDTGGGQATCSITVDGKRLVSSLAQGPNSRATCRTAAGQAND